MADISRETRPALPVVRWLQVGAGRGCRLALTVAPAIAVADDGSSSAASESSARSTAARASRHVAGTGPRSAEADVARLPPVQSEAALCRPDSAVLLTSIRPGVAARSSQRHRHRRVHQRWPQTGGRDHSVLRPARCTGDLGA